MATVRYTVRKEKSCSLVFPDCAAIFSYFFSPHNEFPVWIRYQKTQSCAVTTLRQSVYANGFIVLFCITHSTANTTP